MPTFVTLYKWTDQAAKDVKNAVARFQSSKKHAESLGGKVRDIYVTMGEYDVVTISEAPNDETAAALALSLASKGNVKSMTMRAFTEGEFTEILTKVS